MEVELTQENIKLRLYQLSVWANNVSLVTALFWYQTIGDMLNSWWAKHDNPLDLMG